MITAVIVIGLALVVIVIIRLIRRKKRPATFRLRDVGSMIDRSISAYRRHLLPALILSAICLPLGSSSTYSVSLLSGMLPFVILPDSTTPMMFLIAGLSLINALGIGKTLLACGVAAGMRAAREGQPVTLGAFFPRRRLGAVLGLVLLMIIPSILSAMLGFIGGLIALFWAVAPAVMLHEDLGPWAATKRSTTIVRANYSALLNTVVPLWVIGWLIVGTPLFVGLWLLGFLGLASGAMASTLLLCGWVIAQVCVAPITAFGSICFYLYVQEHTPAPLDISMETAPAWDQL
jgi:hypothetical protein